MQPIQDLRLLGIIFDKLGLSTAFQSKVFTSRIRNPDLHWAQSGGTQTVAMLLNPL